MDLATVPPRRQIHPPHNRAPPVPIVCPLIGTRRHSVPCTHVRICTAGMQTMSIIRVILTRTPAVMARTFRDRGRLAPGPHCGISMDRQHMTRGARFELCVSISAPAPEIAIIPTAAPPLPPIIRRHFNYAFVIPSLSPLRRRLPRVTYASRGDSRTDTRQGTLPEFWISGYLRLCRRSAVSDWQMLCCVYGIAIVLPPSCPLVRFIVYPRPPSIRSFSPCS